MFKKLIKISWNLLALFGLFCMITGMSGLAFIIKAYNLSPQEVVLKIFEKTGITSGYVVEMLQPEPVRSSKIKFPDIGASDWQGPGACKTRTLQPVIYKNGQRPVPNSWLSIDDQSDICIQNYLRIVQVSNSSQFLAALKSAKAGDVITLNPGTYKINSSKIKINASGTAERPIVVKAEHFEDVRLELDTVEGFWITSPFWIFENLDIKGIKKNHNSGEHAFHLVGNAKSFVLRNCRVHEFNAMIKAGHGGDVKGIRTYPDLALIQNNTFYNSHIRKTGNPVTFIDVVGANDWIVRGNLICDFGKGSGNKISYAAFFKGNSSRGVFENNLVIGSYHTFGGVRVGLSLGGGGTIKGSCRDRDNSVEHTGGIIRNNVIMYCSDVGIYLNKAKDSLVANNIVYKTGGIDVRFKESHAKVINNILSGKIRERSHGTVLNTCNIELSAEKKIFQEDFQDLFINPLIADFSLRNGSLIIDKGQANDLVKDDFFGNKRVNAPDIGPFEYNQTNKYMLFKMN